MLRVVNLEYGQAITIEIMPRNEKEEPKRNVKISFRLVPGGAWREIYLSQEKGVDIGYHLLSPVREKKKKAKTFSNKRRKSG